MTDQGIDITVIKKREPLPNEIDEDLESVWNYLTKRVAPKKITLFGISLGTAVTLQFANKLVNKKLQEAKYPKSIILQSGPSSIRKMAKDIIGTGAIFINNDYDSKGVIKNVDKHIPVLLLHSASDDYISIDHKDDLIAECENAVFEQITGRHELPQYPINAKRVIRQFVHK